MSADLLAAFVRGIGGGVYFFDRHRHDISRKGQAMAAGQTDLDNFGALLDLVTRRFAELVGTVADQNAAIQLQFPPRRMDIDRAAGSYDLGSAGEEAWSRY